MDWLLPLYALIGLGAWAALLVAWSRRETIARHTSLPIFLALVALACWMPVQMLGRSKPLWMGPSSLQGARLVSYVLKPKTAIYITVILKDEDEPRLYRLPWSDKQAERLGDAEREAKERQGGVTLRKKGDGDQDDEGEYVPYADPPTGNRPSKVY